MDLGQDQQYAPADHTGAVSSGRVRSCGSGIQLVCPFLKMLFNWLKTLSILIICFDYLVSQAAAPCTPTPR